MRINFDEDKMAYIGMMADKLDISIPELCLKALHIVDTVQLCANQGIKAVFLEEDDQLEFTDLFDIFSSDGPEVGADGPETADHPVRIGPVDPADGADGAAVNSGF